MRGYLKDAVRAGIDDRLSGSDMFVAEFLDDLRTARYDVPERAASDPLFKRIHKRFRKPVRIGLERFLQCKTGHFPVPAGRIFRMCLFRAFTVASDQSAFLFRQTTSVDVRKPESAHIRYVEMSSFFKNVADGICADVAEVRRIGQPADACAVQNDQNSSFFHVYPSMLSFYIILAYPIPSRQSV